LARIEAYRVSSDDRLLGKSQSLEVPPVDQGMLRGFGEVIDGALHGKTAGPVDIDGVDLFHRGESDRPGDRYRLDVGSEPLARRRIELLGIIDSRYARARCKHDCRRCHGPSERAHARLVHAGDMLEPFRPERRFVAQQPAEPLCL
jgi:hypothetical protein